MCSLPGKNRRRATHQQQRVIAVSRELTLLREAKRRLSTTIRHIYPTGLVRYYLYTKSAHFEPELWLVPLFVSHSGLAIDVGANAGHWSLQLSRYTRAVHAFEPNPICLSELRRVLPRRVAIHPIALSDRSEVFQMRFDPNNTGIGTIEPRNRLLNNPGIETIETIDVTSARLDDFNFHDVEFIKIDVEGHEEAVLLGGAATIERDRPTIVCEIEERHNPGSFVRVNAFLEKLGYQVGAVQDGRLHHLDSIRAKGAPRLASSAGINNFVFIDKRRAAEVFEI